MNAQMQSRVRGGLAAAGSLTAIVTGMMLMNDRVREQGQHLLAGRGASPEVSATAGQLQSALFVALDVLRDQSVAHAPLTIFALAATVLLLVMLRT
jgi:hypothetical protein